MSLLCSLFFQLSCISVFLQGWRSCPWSWFSTPWYEA